MRLPSTLQKKYHYRTHATATYGLSGTRNVLDVTFSYTHRNTDFTEKFLVRCDVTEEFPFLLTKMSPYYDR
jgi:hypothetical protein